MIISERSRIWCSETSQIYPACALLCSLPTLWWGEMVFIINANEVIKHQQDVQENNGIRFLYELHYFRATPQNSAYNGTLFQAQKKSNQNNLVLLFVIFVVIFLFVNSLHQISSSPSDPKRLYPNNLKLRVFAEKDSDASTRFLVRVILTTSRRACSCSHSGIPRLHKDMGLVQDVLLIEDDDIAQ